MTLLRLVRNLRISSKLESKYYPYVQKGTKAEPHPKEFFKWYFYGLNSNHFIWTSKFWNHICMHLFLTHLCCMTKYSWVLLIRPEGDFVLYTNEKTVLLKLIEFFNLIPEMEQKLSEHINDILPYIFRSKGKFHTVWRNYKNMRFTT